MTSISAYLKGVAVSWSLSPPFPCWPVIQLLHAEGRGRVRSMLVINDESDGTRFDITQRAQKI